MKISTEGHGSTVITNAKVTVGLGHLSQIMRAIHNPHINSIVRHELSVNQA